MSVLLGVLADTHIPDRAREIPPQVLDLFACRRVDAILHAGDISLMRVLHQLEEIAPVYAVRGNTDILLTGQRPNTWHKQYEGVLVGMTHSHGGMLRYIPDRIQKIFTGPNKFSYYENIARKMLPQAKAVVCGHTHTPANYWWDNQLIFNPGSSTIPNVLIPGLPPSVGFLHIDQSNLHGEIVFI